MFLRPEPVLRTAPAAARITLASSADVISSINESRACDISGFIEDRVLVLSCFQVKVILPHRQSSNHRDVRSGYLFVTGCLRQRQPVVGTGPLVVRLVVDEYRQSL